jgi:hypothetical protein
MVAEDRYSQYPRNEDRDVSDIYEDYLASSDNSFWHGPPLEFGLQIRIVAAFATGQAQINHEIWLAQRNLQLSKRGYPLNPVRT